MLSDQQALEAKKDIARFTLGKTLELQNRLMDENSAAFRWLMASLLLVNAGGAVGLMSAANVKHEGAILGGSVFIAGVFFALLLGFWTLKSAERALLPIGNMTEFWLTVSYTAEIDESELKRLQRAMLESIRWTKLASYVSGFISAGCFVVGSAIVGCYLK